MDWASIWSWKGRTPGTATRFTPPLRSALVAARAEAARLSSATVDPCHVVLGLLAADQSEVRRVLAALSVASADLVLGLEALSSVQATTPRREAELPFSRAAKGALEAAMAVASELGAEVVTGVHLLIGVIADPRSECTLLLRQFGITRDRIHELAERAQQGPAPLAIVLDDEADTPIHEQIVARIAELIATSVLQPGDRLPTVRQLAEQLEVAPGTVARSYRDLEASGKLETAGARGTFVAAVRRPDDVSPPMSVRDLLRPAVVAAFHLGASAAEVRAALNDAMRDIYRNRE